MGTGASMDLVRGASRQFGSKMEFRRLLPNQAPVGIFHAGPLFTGGKWRGQQGSARNESVASKHPSRKDKRREIFLEIRMRQPDRLRPNANPNSRRRGSSSYYFALSLCARPQRAALDGIASLWRGPRGRWVLHVCYGPASIGQVILRHAAGKGTCYQRPLFAIP
jgi:hypothetical protein